MDTEWILDTKYLNTNYWILITGYKHACQIMIDGLYMARD